MKLLSVAVGRPKDVEWRGATVISAIGKSSVLGPVAVRYLNLDGDQQADLSVHGGHDKAVYAYPSEHYDYWRRELPDAALEWGAFGENLTTLGLSETTLRIGDHLRIGTCALVVTQPRTPCFKLNARFRRADMVQRFLRSGRSGFYLAVITEGHLCAGDAIALHPTPAPAVTVADVVSLIAADAPNAALLRRAMDSAALPHGWRAYFAKRLENLGSPSA